jgi:hypothetical protein
LPHGLCPRELEAGVTATAIDDLTWVTFGSDDGETCDGVDDRPCPLEAVARSVWAPACAHVQGSWLHCVTHLSVLQGACAAGDWHCVTCGAPVRLLRIEPVR